MLAAAFRTCTQRSVLLFFGKVDEFLSIGGTETPRYLDAGCSFDGALAFVALGVEVPLIGSLLIVVEELVETQVEFLGVVLLVALW